MKKWTNIEGSTYSDGHGNHIRWAGVGDYGWSIYELTIEVDGKSYIWNLRECCGIREAIEHADKLIAKLESGWRPVNW